MTPQHYILITGANHSPKIIEMIKRGTIQEGKSYPIDKTPSMYDPNTYQPLNRWLLVLNQHTTIIENIEFETSFTTLQNWRNLQISKLTGDLPNVHLIEYLNYLNTQLLIIKEELIKKPLKDADISEESQIIGNQIKLIKEKLLMHHVRAPSQNEKAITITRSYAENKLSNSTLNTISMKLLLISHNNTTWDISDLPLNQWYEVEAEITERDNDNNIKNIFYSIKTHYGSISWIRKENFLTPEQWREQKLNNLLNTQIS